MDINGDGNQGQVTYDLKDRIFIKAIDGISEQYDVVGTYVSIRQDDDSAVQGREIEIDFMRKKGDIVKTPEEKRRVEGEITEIIERLGLEDVFCQYIVSLYTEIHGIKDHCDLINVRGQLDYEPLKLQQQLEENGFVVDDNEMSKALGHSSLVKEY